MLDLKKLLTKTLGCCYSLGTDGYWEWKKYTDGTFEMWRHYGGAPTTGSHYTTINGFYGYYVSGFNFPSSCKPTNANYFVKTSWWIGSGFALDATGLGKTATGFNTYALATASSQTTVTADIYVAGRWK